MAARAYTHGWDGFAPSRPLIYHFYNTKKGPERPLHWDDNYDWSQMRRISLARRDYMLAGTEPVDCPAALAEIEEYGLGTVRTIEEFEEFSGVDFKKREVSDMALKGENTKTLSGNYSTGPNPEKEPVPADAAR